LSEGWVISHGRAAGLIPALAPAKPLHSSHFSDRRVSHASTIYKEQWELEGSAINESHKFLFIDTEFIIGKVWYEHVYNKPSTYFDNMIKQYPYDFYLLTFPDLPWEADPLRENPGKGLYFFEWYKNILEEHKLPYSIVSGIGDDRLQCAVKAINQHFYAS
jgi:nicotinamide riboside kinase